jgi:hypothetical protein
VLQHQSNIYKTNWDYAEIWSLNDDFSCLRMQSLLSEVLCKEIASNFGDSNYKFVKYLDSF